jgi:hypothetical protein
MHGLWYYLPQTVIQVEIVAEKQVEKAGPFFRFAQRFLNVTDVITENQENWQIVDAKVTTSSIPDKKQLYSVNTVGTPSIAALSLREDGVLQGVNIQVPAYANRPTGKAGKQRDLTMADVNFNNTPYTEDQLIKSSTAAMAEEVAKEIYRLREMRTNILKGDVDLLPPDKGAYELVLSEIAKQEKAYLELFTGKREMIKVSQFFDFTPDAENPLNTVLLRFSQANGFLDKMDVSGTPVYIEVEVDEQNRKDFVAVEDKNTQNRTGLAYRIPVVGHVKIIDRTLLLTSADMLLGQFGQVVRLPATLLDKSGVGVVMDVNTGAVNSVFFK